MTETHTNELLIEGGRRCNAGPSYLILATVDGWITTEFAAWRATMRSARRRVLRGAHR